MIPRSSLRKPRFSAKPRFCVESLETREMMSGTGLGHLTSQDLPSHPVELVHVQAGSQTHTVVHVTQHPTHANPHVKITATVTVVGRGVSPIGTVFFSVLIHTKGKPDETISLGSSSVSQSKAHFAGNLPFSPTKGESFTIKAHYGGAVGQFHASTGTIPLRYV